MGVNVPDYFYERLQNSIGRMEWQIMGWFIVEFLINGTVYNGVFIIFCITAYVSSSKSKPYKGLLVTGLLGNTIPYFGFFSGLKRNPEVFGNQLGTIIGNLIYLAIFLLLILFACSKSYRKATEKTEAEKSETPVTDSE